MSEFAIATDARPADSATGTVAPSLILSFDVEEHHRIEAAQAGSITVPASLMQTYADRMESSTRMLLERLAATGQIATFYIVGEIARSHRRLVSDIAYAGHEIGAHSWDHRRVHRFHPRTFVDDLVKTKSALEDASGMPVFGFRAPTFSIMHETAWGIDALVKAGYAYDSSIYPVRHDRYGVPDAPRSPFVVIGPGGGEMLELPPVTYRMMGQNLPIAGGGYFRLLPLWVTRAALREQIRSTTPPVAMMYFHPWEFDPGQPKLPLKRLSRFRTYVGIGRSMARLNSLLNTYSFRRAIDVVTDLYPHRAKLPRYVLGNTAAIVTTERVSMPVNEASSMTSSHQ
jgi:polysaccharide deacetylase family protein (PEP-CTERM system associated)